MTPGEWGSERALRAGETTLNEQIDIDAFGGRRRIIQNSAAPLFDGRGEIVGAVVVNEDVTERVAAEQALRKTQRLLVEAERLGETGSWEHDLLTGEIVNSEENRRLFFGDDRGKGERFEDYAEAVHPADRDWVIRRRTQLLAGEGRPDIEFRVVRPDGDSPIRTIPRRSTKRSSYEEGAPLFFATCLAMARWEEHRSRPTPDPLARSMEMADPTVSQIEERVKSFSSHATTTKALGVPSRTGGLFHR